MINIKTKMILKGIIGTNIPIGSLLNLKICFAVIDKFFSDWENLLVTKGTSESVAHFKEMRLILTRYLSGNPILVSQRIIGITKDGIPKVLGQLVPFIRDHDFFAIRFALTLLSIGRMVKGTGIPDLKPIISEYSGTLDFSRVLRYTDMILYKFKIKVTSTEWVEPHLSTKTGPLGQAISTSLLDLQNIPDELRKDLLKLGRRIFKGILRKFRWVLT